MDNWNSIEIEVTKSEMIYGFSSESHFILLMVKLFKNTYKKMGLSKEWYMRCSYLYYKKLKEEFGLY